MKISLLLVCSFLILGNSYSQKKEKIKGNKIVISEQRQVEPFHTIHLYDNFQVALNEDSDNFIDIEADSNLQEYIITDIENGILKIKSSKNIKRSKALNIKISYASEINNINTYDKVEIKSLSPIKSSNLRIESNDNAEVFLSLETDQLTSISNGKSKVELHTNAVNAFYQVNENSAIKGIITSDNLKIDLYQKAYAKLEGDVKSLSLRADRDTDFYGEKLSTNNASLTAEGASDCYVLIIDKITIDAKDKTEIYLLGETPKVTITTLNDEATLYKKKINYSPGLLKLK